MTYSRSRHHRSPSAGTTAGRDSACGVNNAKPLLVSRLRSGEEAAFEAIVTEQQATLIRTAMRYVANRETAEEVVQETWVSVILGLNRFEGRSSLHAWILAILIHKAKDRGVRDKRQKPFSHFKYEDEEHCGAIGPSRFRQGRNWFWHAGFPSRLSDDRTPERLLAAKQAVTCLQQAIEALPTLLKDVLILRDAYGVRTKEICRILNISEENFYVRLHRARERVRTAVEKALG